MDVIAKHKYARMSPQKVREVARVVQGLHVSEALALLNYTPKKAAVLIGKVLQTAIANASHNFGLDEENLVVKLCTATSGGMFKRFMPQARGSAHPILKRNSHITVIVAPPATEEAKPKGKKASK
jgi:large subunit ribosomal protein L22